MFSQSVQSYIVYVIFLAFSTYYISLKIGTQVKLALAGVFLTGFQISKVIFP